MAISSDKAQNLSYRTKYTLSPRRPLFRHVAAPSMRKIKILGFYRDSPTKIWKLMILHLKKFSSRKIKFVRNRRVGPIKTPCKNYESCGYNCCVLWCSKVTQISQEIGVIQGSNLDPVLFYIYSSDFASMCANDEIIFHADDTVLVYVGTSLEDLTDQGISRLRNI